MLPSATPNTRKSRQPAPLIRPSDNVSVFQEPRSTPTAIRMLKVTRMTRRIGIRSASTAVLGRLTALADSSPLCRVCVMATPGSDRCWTLLDAAEHRVGADGQVGLPARLLQVGPGEQDPAGAPADLDAVGVAVGHGQGEGVHAVVVPA